MSKKTTMRTAPILLLLLGIAVSLPARAQMPASPPPTSPLSIPLPSGAAVQIEMDGKDTDLLGMVKGLLAGAVTPKTGAGVDSAAGGAGNPLVSLLGDGQLTTLLKDIHHLHIVSFRPADVPFPVSTVRAAAPALPPTDFLAFYEKPFVAEGGHRLLYLSGGTSVVTVGFEQPRGFAAVIQSGGTVTVVRADGYPDMTVVGSLLRTFGSAIPTLSAPHTTPPPAPPAPPTHKAIPKATRAKARRA